MTCDHFGRKISYLRISVTDRCNMRCVYCMPSEGVQSQSHTDMIRYEEILEVVKTAVKFGVTKIRLTGGEPLVRKNLPSLVRSIADLPEITDLALTTNGLLLENMAGELADAGLNRVNISLDTLDEEKFSKITRGGSLKKVIRGIEAAEANHLTPIKINVVAVRGVNDDEFELLARQIFTRNWHIRFIELMPVNNQMSWGDGFPNPEDAFISNREIFHRLESMKLELLDEPEGDFGPAKEYRVKGALGTVGFISPISEHFCSQCNRLRLTADGNLRPCLLRDTEIPLLHALRAGESIDHLVQEAIEKKPRGHELSLAHFPSNRAMRQIGG